MDAATGLTVFFDGPFGVGIFERTENGRLSVCKVTFGAEPKDSEIWDFVQKNYCRLKFSPSVEASVKKKAVNPKRIRREAGQQTSQIGIGTKSQQALQLQREENKLMKRTVGKEERDREKQRKYELRQQKRKEKHRGR